MRLPVEDGKPGDSVRRRRRRTGQTTNNNNGGSKSVAKNGEFGDAETQRKEKVANFAHHKRVADYLLGKSVGEGSFAKVRLGIHVQTAEEVAIKVMSKARAKKDSYVNKNLRREGRILQMARHRHIVQVYDILETDNNYYLVTEYCRGGELIDIVSDKGCLPEHDVRRYMSQLVSAVSHLHDHGIVHRDLKVENLLLNDRGELKIIDFGLSNVISGTHSDPTRALATQCGSPAYAAPELLAKHMYGPKVDVWSIGVITYALLVGKLPFTVEPFRIPKLCRKMLLGDMNPIPSHLSGNCRHFIRRLLVPDPDMRPTIEQVIKMAWISTSNRVSTKTAFGRSLVNGDLPHPVDIDTEIVREMTSKLNFEFSDVLNCVRKNRPGEALATYYLLLKQRSHSNDVTGRRTNDVIGSDGNLDHGHESDSKSSEDEEGLNDVDDVTNDEILNTVFNKDELYRTPTPVATTPTNEDRGYETLASDFANHTIVDNIIGKHAASPNGSLEERESDNLITKIRTDNPAPQPCVRTIAYTPPEQNNTEEANTEAENLSIRHTAKDSGVDSGKKETEPACDKDVSKAERKTRGQNSMLLRTMSRAREVLRRGSKSNQGKNGQVEESKTVCALERSKYTRRVSKNSDSSGEPSSGEKRTSGTAATPDLKYNRPSPQTTRTLWRHQMRLEPGRVSLPSSPKLSPSRLATTIQRTPSGMQGHDRSSPADERFLSRKTSPYSPQRIVSFRHRTSMDFGGEGNVSPDPSALKLPRISVDRSHLTPSIISNPLGYTNLTPRYNFSTPPRTPVSRDSTIGPTNSGVREMIDKFQSLLNKDTSPKRTISRRTVGPAPRSSDPTASAMAYLASNRVKRDHIRNKAPSNARQLPATHDYATHQQDDPFITHFRRESDLRCFNEDIMHSYTSNRHRSPQNERRSPITGKKTPAALWYKSAV